MQIRKFDFVVGLYIFGVMFAEIMGAKTVPLARVGSFQLNTSVAIIVMPLLFLLPDIIVEVYGRRRAKSVVYTGIVVICLLVLVSSIATHLPPTPRFAATEPAYDTILGYSARLALASLSAFALSEMIDVVVFSCLRTILHKRSLWLRTIAANAVSQFSDSAIFLTIAFYSFHSGFGANASFLLGLLIPYWLLRIGLTVCETPLLYAGVWWLRRDSTPDMLMQGDVQ